MSPDNSLHSIELLWDRGTAYDMFVSLYVLHNPAKFGLRGAWTAGVRSRLPAGERKILALAQEMFPIPLHWLYALPEPKDSAAVLWTLTKLSPAERLPALVFSPEMPTDIAEVFGSIAARRTWGDDDLERVRSFYQQRGKPVRGKTLADCLDQWARPDEFGEQYVQALQVYQAVFFAEEERRIRPVLQTSLQQAQTLAAQRPLAELLETLSQGVRFDMLSELEQLVLAPSYWLTPFIVFGRLAPGCEIVLFGGRPSGTALVPGNGVPDSLLQSLKALADPTRLQILRYLRGQPLTPAQLARRLRLRAPTVIHHLNALRLAGLVQVIVSAENDKRYASRPEAMDAAFDTLRRFLDDEAR